MACNDAADACAVSPVWTRTREKSPPRRRSMSLRTPVSSGRPDCADSSFRTPVRAPRSRPGEADRGP
ncbi:hypothetical protein AB0G83_00405 [Streptomyces klenkii]|uniref:hypothetical protein n=1 Tax=Streptomyces TaxID=1883 RepID=UPI0018928EB6|nr:hypothetical protein [Streptomyces sp. NRRL B-1677]